jgi:hypothetical protein
MIYDQDLIRKDPSIRYLIKQLRAKAEVIFVCYREETQGVIIRIWKYALKLKGKKPLSKTSILYFFKPDAREAVKQNVEIDEDVVEEKLKPARKLEDRLQINATKNLQIAPKVPGEQLYDRLSSWGK